MATHTKIALVKELLDAGTVSKLIEVFLDGKEHDDYSRLVSAVTKWTKVSPKTVTDRTELVFQSIRSIIFGSDKLSLAWIRTSSFEDFYSRLPEHFKKKAEASAVIPSGTKLLSASSSVSPNAVPSTRPSLFPIFTDLVSTDMEPVDVAITHGRFDQRYLYRNPESVQSWMNLTRQTNDYPTFQACETSLNEFLGSDVWQQWITDPNSSQIVVLGAGAAQKDVAILGSAERSHSKSERAIKYCLVDISSHMLTDTIRDIKQISGRKVGSMSKSAIRGDFMQLPKLLMAGSYEGIIADEGKFAFFIPGLTFANLDEIRFINVLNKTSRSDDLVIVGIEFIDESIDQESYIERLKANYDHAALRRLVISSIRNVLDEYNIDVLSNGGKDVVEVDVVTVPKQPWLANSISAQITAKIGDELMPISESKRYARNEFIQFFEAHGFSFVGSWASKLNSQYNQIVFKRTD